MGLKPKLAYLLAVFFVFIACSEDPSVLYSKAETEAALGSRQKALNYLLQIQKQAPDYTDAYVFAAKLFYEDNNLSEAINQCKRGLDAKADSATILRYIGEIYHQSGTLENAYRYYLMAVKADPENVEAQVSIGSILNEKDLYDQALSHFDVALELDSANYLAMVGKGKTLTNAGQTAAAIEVLETAIEIEPMLGEAYGALALAQQSTAIEDQAILDNYALAVKLAPKNKLVWNDYINFMVTEQDAKAAIEVLQTYLYHFPTAEDGRHRLAEKYLELAQTESLSWLDAAKQQCDKALLVNSDDDFSHALLAQIYLYQEKPRLALLAAQLAFEINPLSEYRELIDQAKSLSN